MAQVLTKPIPVKSLGASADRPGGGKPMISSTRIARRVRQLGRQISETYADIETPLVIIVILKGATVFAADLLRSLSIPAELEFVRASSYHGGTTSSGRLQLAHMVDGTLVARHVLLVEDIVDSGLTVNVIAKRIRRMNPASLRIAATRDRSQDRLLWLCHPGPFRHRLRPRLRGPLSRAASHLFPDVIAFPARSGASVKNRGDSDIPKLRTAYYAGGDFTGRRHEGANGTSGNRRGLGQSRAWWRLQPGALAGPRGPFFPGADRLLQQSGRLPGGPEAPGRNRQRGSAGGRDR